MIRTDSDEYFIEPLERGTQELEDQGRVHVVYRRSALLQPAADISVDYQPQGRTVISTGKASSPWGFATTATIFMSMKVLLFIQAVVNVTLCLVNVAREELKVEDFVMIHLIS